MDLKSGESRLLTEADGLVADSLTLTPDERNFCYVAGRSFFLASLLERASERSTGLPAGFDLGPGFGLSDDGLYAALVERKPGMDRLRLITMRTGAAATLAESSEPIADPMPRPRRSSILYRRGENDLALVNFDGAQNRTLRLAPGTLGSALWSIDGRTILYLNFPFGSKATARFARIYAGLK